jgi:hypothetical protein
MANTVETRGTVMDGVPDVEKVKRELACLREIGEEYLAERALWLSMPTRSVIDDFLEFVWGRKLEQRADVLGRRKRRRS